MGVCLNQTVALISVASGTPATADQTGTTYQIVPQGDVSSPNEQDFQAIFNLAWTPTGGSGQTFDASVDVSWDKSNWINVGKITQLTAGGTARSVVDVKVGLYVRATVDVGGSGVTHAWSGEVRLCSNGSFAAIPA